MLFSDFENVEDTSDTIAPQPDRLVALQRFWESKRRDGKLPSKTDFPPEEIKPWLGHILLVDVVHPPPRFRIRLMGVSLVEYAGRDYTGKWFDEIFVGERLQQNIRPYLKCFETKLPCYDNSAFTKPYSKRVVLYRLHLPLADDGEDINVIFGCGYTAEDTVGP